MYPPDTGRHQALEPLVAVTILAGGTNRAVAVTQDFFKNRPGNVSSWATDDQHIL
jgi:1,2-phenylacetyl-CoA epoxidase PaaB subunit